LRHFVHCGCCSQPMFAGVFKLGSAMSQVKSSGKAAAAFPEVSSESAKADLILIGDVVTVAEGQSSAEAVAVGNGNILAIGNLNEVMAHKGAGTNVIDRTGQAILPGFVDPHVHMVSSAAFNLFLDLSPFVNKDTNEVLAKIAAQAAQAKPGEWVVGQQYDTALMPGHRELYRDELDKVAPNNPVFVLAASGHFAYVNGKAYEAVGIGEDVVDPAGGKYQRDSQGRLNGVLAEMGAMQSVAIKITPPNPKDVIASTATLFKTAAAAGCTALNDAAFGSLAGAAELQVVQYALVESDNAVRVAGQIAHAKLEEFQKLPNMVQGGGTDFFPITAVKLIGDGSNQGLTGYLREPYNRSDNRGIANYEQGELNALVTKLHAEGWRISIHANGDAAIDMAITALETAQAANPRADSRHRIEHCSLPHAEQLERIAKAGVSPSFLMNHVYYFGQYFRDEILGPERAGLLDPCASAIKHGARFAFHSDYSVTNINPLLSMQTAVTRKMRDGGEVLNPAECISAEQALRAVTIDAAWQCGFEKQIGSLEVGKRGDFVVLEKNPLKVDPDMIASIKVVETYVGGARKYAAVNSLSAVS